jgi:hypothetical protein
MKEQQQEGVAELNSRLATCGLAIVEQNRFWPNRMVTYFEIGKSGRQTNLVLSDEFIRDLPRTREYQDAVDKYVTAVAGRIRCGSPSVFYCISHVAISIEIDWPIQHSVHNNIARAWLRLNVTNEAKGGVAPVLS